MPTGQLQTDKQVKIQYLPPLGDYKTFQDEEQLKEKLKEWGLSAAKKEFWYKERGFQCSVTIKGYETYGNTEEYNTIVIEFPDGNVSCIHPAFLKEMQQASFGKESMLDLDDGETQAVRNTSAKPEVTEEKAASKSMAEPKKSAATTKPKKEKASKLELPSEKVHFTAAVKQFALTYNPFNEENDEVVVLEDVKIIGDTPIELGLAWCSHSKTLKKFELTPGDQLEFDGKVAAKKLAKGKDAPDEFIVADPVLYKVNNPSKIVKK